MSRCASVLVVVVACGGESTPNLGGDASTAIDAHVADAPPSITSLSISPASIAFGDQEVNSSSGTMYFSITNTGTSTTGLLAVISSGANVDQFTVIVDSCTGFTLAPAASCSLAFAFQPTSLGTKTASYAIGNLVATVSGTSVSSANIIVTPSIKDFGAVDLCANSADVTFTFVNTGTLATGALSAPALGGSDAAQFAIVSETCTSTVLLPNSANSCVVVARFVPMSAGAQSATVSATASPGGTATANLVATGLSASGFYITPATTAFGPVAVGSTSAPATITMTNLCRTATAPLATALAGIDPGAFTITTNNCANVAVPPDGGTCTIEVAFAPTSTGMKSASLDVSNAAPVHAALTGTGQ